MSILDICEPFPVECYPSIFDLLRPTNFQTHSSSMIDDTTLFDEVSVCHTRHMLHRDIDELERLNSGVELLNAEVSRIQTLMARFDERRSHLQNNIFVRKAKIHPLRTYPVELLQEIFKHCLPEDRSIRPNARTAPLLLGQVCHRWRAISYATSELWAGIALEDPGYWISALEISMTQAWLTRAKNWPLTVKIHSYSKSGHAIGYASPLMSLLMSYESHLSHLSLTGQWDYLSSLLRYATSLPMLQSLVLNLTVDRPGSFIVGLSQFTTSSLPPLPQLIHLTLMPQAHPDITLQILAQCPALRHLTMKSYSNPSYITSSSDFIHVEPFVLERLETLDISSDGPRSPQTELIECAPLFAKLTLPSLRHLTISMGESSFFPVNIETWGLFPQLLSLIRRSSCPLEQVMFRNCRIDAGSSALSDLLQYTPSVVANSIHYVEEFRLEPESTQSRV